MEKEWHNYDNHGRIKKFYSQRRGNAPEMNPRKGSWGVGRDYYRVKTDTGEVFVIYYDRQLKKQKRVSGYYWKWEYNQIFICL